MASSDNTDERYIWRLYRDIYRVVKTIPRGRVATYGQIAELAGRPGAARVVGRAMKLCAPGFGVPWYRVLGKRSKAAARVSILDPVGGAAQRALLEKEGVKFTDAGSVSLSRYGWLPLD